MEIKATVHEIGPIQQVTDSFKKRDLIVIFADNPQYPEHIKFESTQDRVTLFDNLAPGDEIEVSFNLRGRPWTNREGITQYFNSLVAWRVVKLASANTAAPAYNAPPPPIDVAAQPGNDDDDDLPF